MINSMRIVFFLFVSCLFSNCSRLTQKSLTLYVTNIKETEKVVNLKVYVNDSLCVNGDFRYSTITPNYDVFVHKFDKDIYTLRVLKDDNQLLADTFNLKKDMFIYISYGEGLEGEGRIFLKKTTINHTLH